MDKPKKSVRRRTAGVTIDEVAALAGVSPMTVSRVINQGKVRDVTRERVLRAVRELGYTPNLAASSLAAAQHTRIALIYTNPSGAYLRELLVGLLRVASSSAIQLVIDYWDNLDAESERRAARALAGRVDGVILPPPLCESQAAVSELVKAGIPVVAIASGRLSEALSCVRIDDFSAGREMTDHLLRQGHTRIGFIRGRDDLSASALRYDGFVTALREAGLAVDPAWSSTVTTPTGPAWLRPRSCCPSAGHRPRFSPATTTWAPPPSRWRIGAGWKCRATCRSWVSMTPRPPPPCGRN